MPKRAKTMERLSTKFQITGSDLQTGQFDGMASVFGSLVDSWCPTIIYPGAFTKTIQENASRVKILWQHNSDWPIGKPILLEETPQGLHVRGQISQTAIGRDAMTLIRDGVVDELSIGFDPIKFDFEEVNGEEVRNIRELKLWEFSPVTFAADPMARITEANRAALYDRFGMCPKNVSTDKADEGMGWSAPTLADFTDQSWGDLTDAEKRKIAGHFAWAASMPPETYGDLKLPHHDPSTGKVVWKGCAAAMGALLGARGGVSIPDADRQKVYDHLKAHYAAFDKEPPAMQSLGTPDEQFHLTDTVAWFRELHEGKVLSTKNKTLVQDAITALQALLTAAEPPPAPAAGQALTERVEALLRDIELDALARGIPVLAR